MCSELSVAIEFWPYKKEEPESDREWEEKYVFEQQHFKPKYPIAIKHSFTIVSVTDLSSMFSCRIESRGRTSIWLPKVFLIYVLSDYVHMTYRVCMQDLNRGGEGGGNTIDASSHGTHKEHIFFLLFYFWSQSSKWRRMHSRQTNHKSCSVEKWIFVIDFDGDIDSRLLCWTIICFE